MDIARVRMHDQVAQRAIIRWRDVEFAIVDREVAAAGQTEEGCFAGGCECPLDGVRDGLLEAVRDAGEVLCFALYVQDHVASLAVPGGTGVQVGLTGVVGRETDIASERGGFCTTLRFL